MAEEWQFKVCRLWQTIGKSGYQRRGTLLYREKDDVGKGCFEGKSEGKCQFRMVMASRKFVLPPTGAV